MNIQNFNHTHAKQIGYSPINNSFRDSHVNLSPLRITPQKIVCTPNKNNIISVNVFHQINPNQVPTGYQLKPYVSNSNNKSNNQAPINISKPVEQFENSYNTSTLNSNQKLIDPEPEKLKLEKEIYYLQRKVQQLEEEKHKNIERIITPQTCCDEISTENDKLRSENLQLKQEINLMQKEIFALRNEMISKHDASEQQIHSYFDSETHKLEKYIKQLMADNEELQLKYQEKFNQVQKQKNIQHKLNQAQEQILSQQQEIAILKEQLSLKQMISQSNFLVETERQEYDHEQIQKLVSLYLCGQQIQFNTKKTAVEIMQILKSMVTGEPSRDSADFKKGEKYDLSFEQHEDFNNQ